jgi:HD-like signal output (HDOD) protein
VALADLDDESRLPEDFWATTTDLALAAASVAPRLGHRAQDALSVGLLAELGTALLHQADPVGHAAAVRDRRTPAARRAAERLRYGMAAVALSGVALDRWGFPLAVIRPMEEIEVAGSLEGAVLRAAYELASRLADDDYEPVSIARISCGRLGERDVVPVLARVRQESDDLRRAILGD